jgi:polyhydroxyalkanoate synthase
VLDPLTLGRSVVQAMAGTALHPVETSRVVTRHVRSLGRLSSAVLRHAVTGSAEPVVDGAPGDRRFDNPAWRDSTPFWALRQAYLLNARTVRELVEASGADEHTRARAAFALGLAIDAASPTNTLFTNPAALERALETGGRSLAKGFANMARDLTLHEGRPSKVDRSAFTIGKDLAATPGVVVYRNELMELIQYAPTTSQVRDVPVLMCPPWINRYYIMDLSPGRSLVQWAVDHGYTTFAISYRNPDASMASTTFEDYLVEGPLAALEVVREVTGAEQVHTVSVCLGGTLTVTMLALLAARGQERQVRSATLLNTLVDHRNAGLLSQVFVDEESVANLERLMERQGYLDADDLSLSFDLMRANDLVFRPLVSSWLLGEDSPRFDLLAWNAHSTRLPAAMHSYYLRRFWLANDLAEDRLEVAGTRLRLEDVTTDCYVVGAIDDHIVPWHNSYATTQLLSSCRYVLSSSGHVAGIVNPPSPKAKMWRNDDYPRRPEDWLAAAHPLADTWWNDWIPWLDARSGDWREPPRLGDAEHPPLCPAPGTYVLGD